MKKIFLLPLTLLVLLFASCKTDVEHGAEQRGETGSLTVSTAAVNESASRSLYISDIKSAIVTVRGYGADGTAFEKSSGVVTVTDGSANGITVTDIPVCSNAVVAVQAYKTVEGTSILDGGTIFAVTDIERGNNSVSVNWESSKKGIVYNALLLNEINTDTLTEENISSINNAIPSDTHAFLIDASSLANDYKSSSLKASSSYKLTAGSVNVTCNDYDGCTLQLSDPISTTTIASTSSPVTISNAAPGTWKLYVLNGNTVEITKTVTVTSGGTSNVTVGEVVVNDRIIVHAKDYPAIYIFQTDGITTNTYAMTPEGDGWYTYTLNVTSAKLIFKTAMDSWDGQTGNLTRTAGEWWFIGNSGTKPIGTWYEVNPEAKTEPSINISPSDGSRVAANGKITVTINPGNDTITTASVSITELSASWSYNDFTNNKLEIPLSTYSLNPGDSITITASAANSAGSCNESASLTVKEAGHLVSNPNELRIYQVMVSHFQDGDSSIGYTNAYGPTGQTYGGDLQGIINALDYLQNLGINALWMTPIFNSNSSYSGDQMGSTGYYTYDYFNIDPRFGSNSRFEELVEACHVRGINVILDGVFGHWGAAVASSPNGKTPTRSHGQYKGCDYPASLDFFKEVAEYWIKEYKIDGWRLDQAYQAGARGEDGEVYTGSTNYWPQLRASVESAAALNGTKGSDWGTLGYMVGEVLDGNAANIQNWVVVNDGLKSCFDFPGRYQLCNAIVGGSDWANSASTDTFVSAMTYTYKTSSEKGYTHSGGYYPNLFLSNHDLLRFGDLIIDWKGYSYGSENYVGKYKVALASIASYTGPITLYMGDEWGEATQGISLIQSTSTPVGKGAYWDNSSRTSGCITKAVTGTASEKEVLEYTKKLMAVRNDHEALWNGSSEVQSTSSSDLFVTKKVAAGEIIYVGINNGTTSKTFSASGKDLLTGNTYTGTVTVPALSAVYLLAD